MFWLLVFVCFKSALLLFSLSTELAVVFSVDPTFSIRATGIEWAESESQWQPSWLFPPTTRDILRKSPLETVARLKKDIDWGWSYRVLLTFCLLFLFADRHGTLSCLFLSLSLYDGVLFTFANSDAAAAVRVYSISATRGVYSSWLGYGRNWLVYWTSFVRDSLIIKYQNAKSQTRKCNLGENFVATGNDVTAIPLAGSRVSTRSSSSSARVVTHTILVQGRTSWPDILCSDGCDCCLRSRLVAFEGLRLDSLSLSLADSDALQRRWIPIEIASLMTERASSVFISTS